MRILFPRILGSFFPRSAFLLSTWSGGGRAAFMKRSRRKKIVAKRVLRLPDLDYAKGAVLNTLGSPESKRAYEFAIDDFVSWYCSEPRLAFNKTVVLRYRLELEGRRLCGDDQSPPGS